LELREKELAPAALGSEVEERDVAHVIELWTGIPASRIQESELKKLAGLEQVLNSKVIGQEEAVAAVSAAIRRSRVQISPRRRPASFIFVGPTGVGKTELVKVLSEELFDTPETLIRLDMSEFMEKHSVSRIIGSPPGYVGYDEAGQVTEKVRRRPYSVLLFDEIEKAHPDVMNILLQILDEGHITDAHGRNVNFENTVLVMTSNAGSERKEGTLGFARNDADVTRERVMKALSDFLRPEFISRVDEIIVFRQLNEDDFEKIAHLMLNEYVDTLKERGTRFVYDEKATRWLAQHAIGGKSGARDLRNLIRREVEDKITSLLVENGSDSLTGIAVTADDENGIQLQVLQ
jgi:ATP-dependent Clp protease ATP-binding subunit ClpC